MTMYIGVLTKFQVYLIYGTARKTDAIHCLLVILIYLF